MTAKRDLAVLLFAMVFPSVMTWLYFVQLAGRPGEQNPAVQLAMGLGKVVQFAFPLVYVWWVGRGQLGWPTFRARGIVLGISFGVLTALAMFTLYYGGLREFLLAGDAPAAVWQKLVELKCDSPVRFLALAVFISVFHALLEEYYWRWFVFGWLRRHVPFWPALIISSLGFMAHHVIVLWVYFPNYFWELAVPFSLAVAVGGGAWAWLYERSRSLYAVWFSHLLVDAAILAVGYDMVAKYW